MLQPKRTKYRKTFRGKRRGIATRGTMVSFGEFGLKALDCGWVTANQIEAARVTISRRTRKGGKMWIRVFPHKPITSKPNEVGMGGGKGDVDNHVVVVRPGMMLFEVAGIDESLARTTLRQAAHKLPINTKVISRS
jgi:large subunit ribosomal protein L16